MKVNPNLVGVAIGSGALTERRRSISERIIDLTGNDNPNILGIGTARHTEERFNQFQQKFTEHFGSLLGVKIDFLHDYLIPPTITELEHKVGNADAIYVSGGNTLAMMEFWNTYGISSSIKKYISEGRVISGGSAGAIALFNSGHSDSRSFEVSEGEQWDYEFVDGLGEIYTSVCPHYDSKTGKNALRRDSLLNMMKDDPTTPNNVVGINNGAGLVVADSHVSVVRCSNNGRVYKVSKTDSGVNEQEFDSLTPIPVSEF